LILACFSSCSQALLTLAVHYFDSYDTGVISAALVNIGTDINGRLLSNVEKEWTTASTSVGALIGAVSSPSNAHYTLLYSRLTLS
jgi:hypothetical protein